MNLGSKYHLKNFDHYYVGRKQRYHILHTYKDIAFVVGDMNDKAFCVRLEDLKKLD